MKIAIVFGTRPEIIKMAPVMRACQNLGASYLAIHTGQHYSQDLDGVFFDQLGIPTPDHNIRVGSGTHAHTTARALLGIERILLAERPDVVLVQGDTNSVLSGALAAVKLHVRVGHLEAGLRSGDRRMPEEINRVLTDHMSDYLFAPTVKARENLLREGIAEKQIFLTGNSIVDAVYQHLVLAKTKTSTLNDLGLTRKKYLLLTLHREENVDVPERFASILRGVELTHQRISMPIIYPIHPRSEKRLGEFGIRVPEGILLTKPCGYLEFLQLLENARLVLTDSGGIQEEACILGVPCVTLRDNTERPETVELGANVLAGCCPEGILSATEAMFSNGLRWDNPFGDGKSGERIIKLLLECL